MTDKALSMIGLATKAGKIASGEFAVESAVRKGKACLVIIASDASDNTKKSFNDMGAYYHVPVYIYGTKEVSEHIRDVDTGLHWQYLMPVSESPSGNLLIQESISDSTILTEVAYVKNQST
mgnify:CR=1 FL=1